MRKRAKRTTKTTLHIQDEESQPCLWSVPKWHNAVWAASSGIWYRAELWPSAMGFVSSGRSLATLHLRSRACPTHQKPAANRVQHNMVFLLVDHTRRQGQMFRIRLCMWPRATVITGLGDTIESTGVYASMRGRRYSL